MNEEKKQEEVEKEEPKKTLEQLLEDKEYQSAFDKRVADILKSNKENWIKEQEEKQAEIERQAGLTAEEKVAERLAELEKREQEIIKQEKISKTKEKLANINIPVFLAENLVTAESTEDEIDKKIEKLAEQYNESIEENVKKKLAGKTPTKGEDIKKEETAPISW